MVQRLFEWETSFLIVFQKVCKIVFQKVCKSFLFSLLQIYSFLIK